MNHNQKTRRPISSYRSTPPTRNPLIVRMFGEDGHDKLEAIVGFPGAGGTLTEGEGGKWTVQETWDMDNETLSERPPDIEQEWAHSSTLIRIERYPMGSSYYDDYMGLHLPVGFVREGAKRGNVGLLVEAHYEEWASLIATALTAPDVYVGLSQRINGNCLRLPHANDKNIYPTTDGLFYKGLYQAIHNKAKD